jgi:hypothetical protein
MNNTAQPPATSLTTGYDSNYKRFPGDEQQQRPLLPSLKEMTDQPMYNAQPMYAAASQRQPQYQQQQQYRSSSTTPNAPPPPQYYQQQPPQLYSQQPQQQQVQQQQQQQQPPAQQQVKTTTNKLTTTTAPPPTPTTSNVVTKRNKKEAQKYSDTIFSEYTEHSDNCIDPETIRFYTRNATFIEYNNGKLLLSSVKHGVTLELPNMEEFDEMNSRIRLVDALTNREVFCSTSSSLRSKGQRVVYGQTLSLFDQCSNDSMSTELEFRFRESTTTNKRPYVLRIEVYKHNELICSFQTEPFNVVWRDPAKTSRKARGTNQAPAQANSPSSGPNVENPRPKKRKLDSGNANTGTNSPPQIDTKNHQVFEYQQPQQQQQQPQPQQPYNHYNQQGTQYPPMYQPKQDYYAPPPQQQQQQNSGIFNGNYQANQGYPQQPYYH